MKTRIFLVISVLFLLVSCSNDSESDLMNNPTPTPNPSTITYINTIKSIMDSNCISCHGTTPSGGAPMSLTTYQNVKDAVMNRGLIDRISRAQGAAGMMPYNGTRLPQSTINQVIDWKNNGFAE
ncbi:Cytochrome C oxidase, cbb3-type, subunit III [Flavobacterium fluvii]|uniref:Cytochrome C oxidase, cbb3-type, subunit III n=1 Tax=Flavobacterium fluvii TaxID=468056 RepID=A0A1M5M512_9FLAO|nr:c-type cytochrome [Flavobacterium fluvii]SHG72338.1 Cytochrome C oxidase, cbb3-type, subunit III [Flavobacterium fluvii]